MDKEKLKSIKVLYLPYKVLKKASNLIFYYYMYIGSLLNISKNKKRVHKKITNREVLNVLFIVQYIPGWNKLEPIYRRMMNDDRFNPVIVCVPLNIRDHVLQSEDLRNDTFEYFSEHGYEVINALENGGNWFDLKKLKPDYVFHSRPYNAFMPECYTSDEIVKYALICNVMYGLNLTKNVEPLLLNKDYFKNCYIYFSFENNEKLFYEHRFAFGIKLGLQKCLNYGGIGIEQMLRERKEKKNSSYRKTIVWTPRWSTDKKIGGSNFFNYKDTILNLVKNHKDCLFVIRPHPLMFDNFIRTREMTLNEVNRFKQVCSETENIQLDESKEYVDMFWQSDILISDASAIVPEYFSTTKPILYCQSDLATDNTEFFNNIISRCYSVFSPDDLVYYFEQLIGNIDFKAKERIEYIDKHLKNYNGNSDKIINSLVTGK